MFSSEFCKISKNTYFTEHLRTTASIIILAQEPKSNGWITEWAFVQNSYLVPNETRIALFSFLVTCISNLFYIFESSEIFLTYFLTLSKQTPQMLYRNAVLKNFAIFTGNHLCWSLYFIQFTKNVLKRYISLF